MDSLSFNEMWEKIMACDSSYDGLFYTAVKTTKIYCRPSCRSRKPKKVNVEFYDTRAEAIKAGFRACKRCQPDTGLSPQAELITRVKSFLVDHFKEPLTLQDVAQHAGVSPFYLERQFKGLTGDTPRTYLEKIRLDKAVYLLTHTCLTNLEICYEAGFQSTSNFYKVFRTALNCSPSEFRSIKEET